MRHLLTLLLCLLPALAQAAPADIFTAARAGDLPAIHHYLDEGGTTEARNERGYTPLILAAYYGHTDAVATLAAAGAAPCATDTQGSNAFMGVAFKGHLPVAEWLLAHTDCDINHRNHAGQTALMMASLFGREDIIKLLLTHGADPTLADASGNTAASLAEGQGLTHIVNLLRFLRP